MLLGVCHPAWAKVASVYRTLSGLALRLLLAFRVRQTLPVTAVEVKFYAKDHIFSME